MDRCFLCPHENACIPADGPEDADIYFVGEAPGKEEDHDAKKHPPGRPFIGKTGQETNSHYLPLAGLRRDGVRFGNAIGCLPTTNGGKLDPSRGPDVALLRSCSRARLYPDIERARPSVIVPLGRFACMAVLGEDFDLELRHGFPTISRFGIPAFPMYHPALGIHEPKKMLYIRNDWDRLRKWLKGLLELPTDPYPTPDYQEVTDASEFAALNPSQPIALDTEWTYKREPFCLTYSQGPGTGRLVRAGSSLLAQFRSVLQGWRGDILLHNWAADYPVLAAMGVHYPLSRVVDTMALVFHLGNLPQGLKALAFRELGMAMQDFEDVVKPYSIERVMTYYLRAASHTWAKPEAQVVPDEKLGGYKLYQPQSMSTKLKRFMTDFVNNPEKDVFQMWEKNWVEQQAMIEEKCGEWPGMCISHVPFDQTLYYACRDVDALIRLYPLLLKMRRRVRKFSQERWRN